MIKVTRRGHNCTVPKNHECKDRCRSYFLIFCKGLRKCFEFFDPVMKSNGIPNPNIVLSLYVLTHTAYTNRPTLYALTSKLPRCVGNLAVQKIDDGGVKLVYGH